MLIEDKFHSDPRLMGFADPLAMNQKLNQKHKTVNSDVNLSTGMLSVEQTQKILQQEVASKLEARFKEEGIELKGLKADNFTPEKVAGRILDFIELGVSRAGDDKDKRMEMLAQAREGVEQGFADAKEILESLNVLQGKVKEDIDKTYNLINNGLNRLTYPEDYPVSDKEDDSKQVTTLENATMRSSAAAESRSTSVEILTRDGDKVTIDLQREQRQSSSQFSATDGNNSIYAASYSSSSYTNISYQVKGELDEGERAAIDDLLGQLNSVAKDFYQGDMEAAFNKAKEVGFDSSELAKFSVDMSHQQINTTAVSSYQSAQQDNSLENEHQRKGRGLDQGNGNGQGRAQSNEVANENAFVRDAAEFMQQMDQLMKHNAFDLFANADKALSDLLDSALKLQSNNDDKKADKDDENSKSSAFNSINDMIAALSDPNLTETNANEA